MLVQAQLENISSCPTLFEISAVMATYPHKERKKEARPSYLPELISPIFLPDPYICPVQILLPGLIGITSKFSSWAFLVSSPVYL